MWVLFMADSSFHSKPALLWLIAATEGLTRHGNSRETEQALQVTPQLPRLRRPPRALGEQRVAGLVRRALRAAWGGQPADTHLRVQEQQRVVAA